MIPLTIPLNSPSCRLLFFHFFFYSVPSYSIFVPQLEDIVSDQPLVPNSVPCCMSHKSIQSFYNRVSQAEGRSSSTDWSSTAWSRPATSYGTGATNPPPPGMGARQSSGVSNTSGSGAASSVIVRQPDHYDLPVRPQSSYQQGASGLGTPSRAVRGFVHEVWGKTGFLGGGLKFMFCKRRSLHHFGE